MQDLKDNPSNSLHIAFQVRYVCFQGKTRLLLLVVVDIHDGSLTVESCLKDYPATLCYTDELPAHVGVRTRSLIVNADTCDCGVSQLVAFHFPLV